MNNLLELTRNPRVTVRRDGPPGPHGTCVVYWMQRAQRGIDNPALVVGDENPIRQARGWRDTVTKKLKIPLWTVDADVIVPSKLLEKPQYAAFLIRPRLESRLRAFLVAAKNPRARVPWSKPRSLSTLETRLELGELTSGWNIDRSVEPV